MKLFHRVILMLALGLLPVMALWSVLFYYSMVNEINDEADDVLGDYAELIMRRALAGKPLPAPNSGSNNSYSIVPVDEEYVNNNPSIIFYDEMTYIPEKEETEPARVLKTIFCNAQGDYFELQVATPTFERIDLLRNVAYHILALYVVIMLTMFLVISLVYYFNMRPLYRLLEWFDGYRPGEKNSTVPSESSVLEFRKLNEAARSAVDRAEHYFEQQKLFIGNASHELQTPLAVLGTRLEWLVDNTELTEQQLTEMMKMRSSLSRLVRLNKTLLLLSKIENGQFPDATDVDISAIVRDNMEIYEDIYSERSIESKVDIPSQYIVHVNDVLATTLVGNLLKNAFVHNVEGGHVNVILVDGTLTVANSGTEPLDASRIFERFYHKGSAESTGLGLALVSSICRYYNMPLEYSFADGMHHFTVCFNNK
ncbi:MAG: HAMP domain-containing histidine kinase [Bacteroidaceae bacterium]|nr:HAMP domain-containing histidine kinase [Bacteroidaceae bacterium]